MPPAMAGACQFPVLTRTTSRAPQLSMPNSGTMIGGSNAPLGSPLRCLRIR